MLRAGLHDTSGSDAQATLAIRGGSFISLSHPVRFCYYVCELVVLRKLVPMKILLTNWPLDLVNGDAKKGSSICILAAFSFSR
jgi:hypothetical protein